MQKLGPRQRQPAHKLCDCGLASSRGAYPFCSAPASGAFDTARVEFLQLRGNRFRVAGRIGAFFERRGIDDVQKQARAREVLRN